jgi:hypothetical protein
MANLIYSMITSLDGYVEDPDGVSLELDLVDERRFDSGVVYLRYRTRRN